MHTLKIKDAAFCCKAIKLIINVYFPFYCRHVMFNTHTSVFQQRFMKYAKFSRAGYS